MYKKLHLLWHRFSQVLSSASSNCKFSSTIAFLSGRQHLSRMNSTSTAGIIVIGDEILSGETQDTNSHFLTKELLQCGVKVMRISVIPDCINTIAEEVSKFSSSYTYVLTTGGVGPTHDDMTYAGVAKAFQQDLVLNNYLESVSVLVESMPATSVKRMCTIPKSATVHPTKHCGRPFVPIISVQNVFMFPGIPSYLRYTFGSLKVQFQGQYKIHQKYLYIDLDEFAFIDELNDVAEHFAGKVDIGSYPRVESKNYAVKLILKSEFEDDLLAAEAYIRNTFPSNSIVDMATNTQNSYEQLYKLMDESSEYKELAESIRNSLSSIQDCFKRYSFDNVCLSFNGGKDCTVLLYLTHCLFLKENLKGKLKAFYVSDKETFPEVHEFVQECAKRYDLSLLNYTRPMQEALTKLKTDHPEIKCVIMGMRSTDPGGNDLEVFHATDEAWPQFMRCSPIIRWNYHQIWQLLRLLQIPYCSLYDKGYTSLGCRKKTVKNPKLKVTTTKGKEFYYPAYLLKEQDLERDGRLSSK